MDCYWQDAFPLDPTETKDSDGDGIGDNKDTNTDTDGDSKDDGVDAFPTDPTEWVDTDGDKTVNFEEFASGVEKLKLSPPFRKEELRKLLTAVDIDHSGNIDYEEFVAAFKIKDSSSSTGITVN